MSASAPALLLVGRRLGSWQSTAGQIAFDDYFRVSAAVATRNRKRRAEGRTLPQGRRPAPLRGKSPSLLHLQHEARCGSHGIYLPVRANDATLGGYSSVSSVGYMC